MKTRRLGDHALLFRQGGVEAGALLPLEAFSVEHSRAGRLDRFCRLAVSTAQALCGPGARPELGVFIGTELGSFGANAEHAARLLASGLAGVKPLEFPATVPAAAAGEIAIALGAMGPNVTIASGAASAVAILRAALLALEGEACDEALVGVIDAWHPRMQVLGLDPARHDGACLVHLAGRDGAAAALARLAAVPAPSGSALEIFSALAPAVLEGF